VGSVTEFSTSPLAERYSVLEAFQVVFLSHWALADRVARTRTIRRILFIKGYFVSANLIIVTPGRMEKVDEASEFCYGAAMSWCYG
jgi:hypothetical protein